MNKIAYTTIKLAAAGALIASLAACSGMSRQQAHAAIGAGAGGALGYVLTGGPVAGQVRADALPSGAQIAFDSRRCAIRASP